MKKNIFYILALFLCGCATNPTPQDITLYKTTLANVGKEYANCLVDGSYLCKLNSFNKTWGEMNGYAKELRELATSLREDAKKHKGIKNIEVKVIKVDYNEQDGVVDIFYNFNDSTNAIVEVFFSKVCNQWDFFV